MSVQPIFDELVARGLVYDTTGQDELAKLLHAGSVVFYAGYDPTSTSLHIGNLVPISIMARLQRAGHKPIAVVGGATGMVGDPSGRNDERALLDAETLARNVAAIRSQLSRFLQFGDGPTDAVTVDNHDWTAPITLLGFLRDIGKHLTLNYMIAKESVRARLEDREQGISFTEFSYMLLQAYDFVHLAAEYRCQLQIGASDQWGNITAGCELQRKLGRPPIHGMVCPLLLDSEGNKMGKTAAGKTVWLDADRTSPYAFYQYLLNVPDDSVERLLRFLSFRSLDEIAEIVRRQQADPASRVGQRALAEELTARVHGADAARRALAASQVMFGGALDDLTDADLEPLLGDVPSSRMPRAELDGGIALIDLLARTHLAASKGAARRLLGQGGVYINNQRVSDPELTVTSQHLGTETMMVLRAGKKSYHIVRVD
jgi:tyrosyl-tRNA synthetase